MTKPFPKPLLLNRDGTSQKQRLLAALEPDYVSVDERSLKDLLEFARVYAKELNYYNGENQVQGDWSAFLSDALNLDEITAYMDKLAVEMHRSDDSGLEPPPPFNRPHLALLLTFLQLLRHAQDQMNGLTRRHLDFYYRQVLRLTRRSAIPDQVNILIKLAAGVDRVEMPAGTLLTAGKDALGRDRVYRTDRDIVANRTRVARLSSLYARKRFTGIRDAREKHKDNRQRALLYMLEIALGDPVPGDLLPEYKKGQPVDFDLLLDLQRLVDFTPTRLFMPFYDLRALIRFKQQRDSADDEWKGINGVLEKVGKNRGDPNFRITPETSRGFDANLAKALGLGAGEKPSFDGLTEVEDIFDLYEHRNRTDVRDHILDKLYFDKLADFVAMMQALVKIHNQWGEINRILEQAGACKHEIPGWRLADDPQSFDPTDFDTNLDRAVCDTNPDRAVCPNIFSSLTDIDNINNIDHYYAALNRVESKFFMPAENFSHLMAIALKQAPGPSEQEWEKVYTILSKAHRQKVYKPGRDALKAIRRGEQSEAAALQALFLSTLGDDYEETTDPPLQQLQRWIKKVDYRFLAEMVLKADKLQITNQEWEKSYRLLDFARRNRERLPEPVALKEEWLNLYPHAEAEGIRVSLGVNGDHDHPRWKTFGKRNPEQDENTPPAELFGWAVGSPLLALSQGQRKIVLTLGLSSEGYEEQKIKALFPTETDPPSTDQGAFRLQVSTETGWIEPHSLQIKSGEYQALCKSKSDGEIEQPLKGLQLILTFLEDAEPIVAPGETLGINSPWPVVKLLLRQIWNEESQAFITRYSPLKPLQLEHLHIKVEVGSFVADNAVGLTTLQLQNEQTRLDSSKPFEPFGSAPAVGSRLLLGHRELMHKRLDRVGFRIDWMGVPKQDLSEHYKNYDQNIEFKNEGFKIQVSLIENNIDRELQKNTSLFRLEDATQPHHVTIDMPAALSKSSNGWPYDPDSGNVAEKNLPAWNRYLQWKLNNPDFQHSTYPAVATKKSIEMAVDIARKEPKDATEYQVSPPYTPRINGLSLDYVASLGLALQNHRTGPESEQIFHIHPFGYAEIQPDANMKGIDLLPQYDFEGELYIGIQEATPPQNLAFLFQMAEGSADPDLEPAKVQWSYLSDNHWHRLEEGNILSDSTRGLINSGIIEFDLQPVVPSTLLPPEFYWLRGAVKGESNSLCDTVTIDAQAVCASFVNRDNAPDHYRQPLPANTISATLNPIAGIAGLEQPYTSFAGQMAEQESSFNTRVSERLRHKRRAVTIWDYEHLVLERFPQIYKAKCLPVDLTRHPDDAGKLALIVIPDIRERLPFNPFQPKAPADLIRDIETYLAGKSPPSAHLKVKNAHYVPVKVRFGVRFKPGYDEGFYKQRLNEQLNRFLSPWAYEKGADIVIGGRIFANSIVNFIDRQEYVDYVAEIKLFSAEDGHHFRPIPPSNSGKSYFVTTDRPDGVLVAADRHEIDIITETGYEEESFTGINYMKIELDFIIREDMEAI
ncbi:MAG: hypothetical protein GY934_21300 [Gammaproteobacteria bacterium]|nr:hypothetical protein [Gammaproteobacteria bacterium]